jgi:hypothetical protein
MGIEYCRREEAIVQFKKKVTENIRYILNDGNLYNGAFVPLSYLYIVTNLHIIN